MELFLFHFKLYLVKGIISGYCKILVTFPVENDSINEFRIHIQTKLFPLYKLGMKHFEQIFLLLFYFANL